MLVKECIKNVRYKLCLTQRDFAKLVGVDKASISLYETGERVPSLTSIRKIVDKLKEKNINLEYSDLMEKE